MRFGLLYGEEVNGFTRANETPRRITEERMMKKNACVNCVLLRGLLFQDLFLL
jgi:hypothetical protein